MLVVVNKLSVYIIIYPNITVYLPLDYLIGFSKYAKHSINNVTPTDASFQIRKSRFLEFGILNLQ